MDIKFEENKKEWNIQIGDKIMLQIENVKKVFGENIVLNKISLICEYGKIYGIIGRNGCGKSVLFKCICGLLQIEEGVIIIDEENIYKNPNILKKIGMIIEKPAFLSHYNGLKNLKILYSINNKIDKNILCNYMELVGLNPEDPQKVYAYSMGMKQRLAIAQAIMENQRILILDEPFNGLDKESVEEIREIIISLKKDKIILLASHNSEDIKKLCDEVYELDKGLLTSISKF